MHRTPYRVAMCLMPLALLVCGCFSQTRRFEAASYQPNVLLPASMAGIHDGRGRFREIFDAVMAARPGVAPRAGEDACLWRLAGEPQATGAPVGLGPSSAGLTVLIVPGLLAECVSGMSTVFGDSLANLEEQGYATGYIQTHGRHGADKNAAIVRQAVVDQPEGARIVLVAHSKGTVDCLEALAAYPELARRVVALVSVSGAVNGSPLADAVPTAITRIAGEMRLSSCPPGQGAEAVESLRRETRLLWLARNPLPRGVRYYSLAALVRPRDVSLVLKPFYDVLAEHDPANDGMVLCSDMIVPGSTLLGYPNADHLAVAMPFADKNPVLSALLITRNAYPRKQLLESIIRYVEEDLANGGDAQPATQ